MQPIMVPPIMVPDPSFRTFIRALWHDPAQQNLRRHIRNTPATRAWLEQDGPLPDIDDDAIDAARSRAEEQRITLED